MDKKADKKLEWTKPILVDLGNTKRMSSGQQSICIQGTGALTCGSGGSAEIFEE